MRQLDTRLKRSVVVTMIVAVGLISLASNPIAQADSDGKARIVPRDANAYGNPYGEWAARWWQWVLSIPSDRNPATDTTGAYCGEDQQGPVWFLGSTFGGPAVIRECVIPAGKALFFPIASVIGGAGAFDCEPSVPGVACNLAAVRVLAAAATDPVNLEVTLDGTAIRRSRDQRVQTPTFTLTYPDNNAVGAPPGTNNPNIADGYWLMLEPLRAGAHTLYSKAEFTGGVFAGVVIEATYHLTIEP